MKTTNRLLIILFSFVILSSLAYATSHLPIGLLKIMEYNQGIAQDFLQNISFAIAFLAGMISIVSPCILPLIPAYFAVTFQSGKKSTLSTFIFFLGFTTVFIAMGVLAAISGKSLLEVFGGLGWLIIVAGILMIFFGVMILLGKGFPGFNIKHKTKKNIPGIFISGTLFAIGWSACTGPLISGVLIMTAAFNNYITAAYLMFAYSLGIFVPLFILSFFYDKSKLEKIEWMSKEKKISLFGKTYSTNLPKIIAGILFIALGAIFIIFRGTRIFNSFQMFGLKNYFYSWQDFLIANTSTFNIVGLVIFAVFAAILAYFVVKEFKNG